MAAIANDRWLHSEENRVGFTDLRDSLSALMYDSSLVSKKIISNCAHYEHTITYYVDISGNYAHITINDLSHIISNNNNNKKIINAA